MARVGHFPLGIYPSFIAGMLPRLPDQLRHQVAMLAEFEPRFRQVLTGGLRVDVRQSMDLYRRIEGWVRAATMEANEAR